MGKRYKTSEITCQAISGVLKQLMIQKPLERITVAEIMDTCGMRRQHFYYYFTDIYDLLRWTFEKEALELLQQQQGVFPWQNGFLHLFQYINQNRAVCLCALDSLGKESLKQLLEADVSSIVDRAVRQTAVENGLPAHSPEVEVVICLVTIMMAGGGGELAPGRVDPDTGGADPADRYDVSGLYSRRGPSAEGFCRCIRIENEEGVFL